MASTLTAFFDKPWTKIILSYLVVLCIGVGIGVWGHIRWQTPPAPEIRVVENVKYVDVPVDKIVYKDVVKYVRDDKEIKKLLTEAAWQENQIATLTETIATLRSTTTTTETKTVFVDRPGAPEAHFKDWRLTFDATPAQTTYQLNQKFESIAAIGKDAQGKPVVRTKLFEIGPGEKRTELTDASTIVVSAVPNPKRWFFHGAIQAGATYVSDTSGKATAGGVVALKWLHRGYSKSAEDGIWSVASPALFITTGGVEPALLPVSVNMGRIPKQPFRDLWISPVFVFGVPDELTTNPANSLLKSTKFGISLTATF